ncbi:MAG: hypothetical protein WC823_03760 [Parcubacteria group bacterium]|jgi:hypothetical protein
MKKFILGAGLLLSVLLVFGVIFYGNVIAALWFIPHIMEWLEPLGVGKYFSLVLAIPLAVWISISIGKVISFNREKRLQGILMATGAVVALALLLGVMTRNYRFDPQSGSPQYSFSWDVNGGVKILPKTMKVDPETGAKTMPLLPNIVQGSAASKDGTPSFAPLSVSKNSRFFSPDGMALFYYYEYADGRIEFFSHGGVHPQIGAPLFPVNDVIMKKFNDYLSSGKEKLILGYDKHLDGAQLIEQKDASSGDAQSSEQKVSPYQNVSQGGLRKMSEAYKYY